MDAIRHALGLKASAPPPMSDEQAKVAEQQRRIRDRLKTRQDAITLSQQAVDLQIDVLRRDQADERRGRQW
jgi:hypothetical protein